jgi:hypothetical protein
MARRLGAGRVRSVVWSRLAGIALVAAALGSAAPAAAACAVPAGFAPRGRVADAGILVLYRTLPAAIEVGRHFSVDALVCADTGPAVLARVDAHMPEHRHGMNYRATLAARGGGRYVAEGLLFHMPGRWQLVFDVERAGQRTRLTSEVEVE